MDITKVFPLQSIQLPDKPFYNILAIYKLQRTYRKAHLSNFWKMSNNKHLKIHIA